MIIKQISPRSQSPNSQLPTPPNQLSQSSQRRIRAAPLPPAEPEVKQEETDRDMDAEAEADQAITKALSVKPAKNLKI